LPRTIPTSSIASQNRRGFGGIVTWTGGVTVHQGDNRPNRASGRVVRTLGPPCYEPEGNRTNSKCIPSGTSHRPPHVNPQSSRIFTRRASWWGVLPNTLRDVLMSNATPHAWWEIPDSGFRLMKRDE